MPCSSLITTLLPSPLVSFEMTSWEKDTLTRFLGDEIFWGGAELVAAAAAAAVDGDTAVAKVGDDDVAVDVGVTSLHSAASCFAAFEFMVAALLILRRIRSSWIESGLNFG